MVVSDSYNCIILSDWSRVTIFTRTVQSYSGLSSYQSHIISLLVLAHCEITTNLQQIILLYVNNLLVNKAELKNTHFCFHVLGSFKRFKMFSDMYRNVFVLLDWRPLPLRKPARISSLT